MNDFPSCDKLNCFTNSKCKCHLLHKAYSGRCPFYKTLEEEASELYQELCRMGSFELFKNKYADIFDLEVFKKVIPEVDKMRWKL